MNVLIADKFQERGIEQLRRGGCEVTPDPDLSGAALREAVERTSCQVLVVRSTRVDADVLPDRGRLGLIVRAGAGVNTIDVAAVSRAGIFVANCPGKNAAAVAELTFALILGLDRRLVENVTDLRNGVWNKKEYSKARGLKDRTLGIVGMGRIGRETAARARAFGMHVIAWSRSLTEELAAECGVERCTSLTDLASRCDVLTVHLPASPETAGIVNAEVLNLLKPGSYLINTARHEVMDYAALADAMSERNLRVGLDVFPGEPSAGATDFTHEILRAGGLLYGTHHIGASNEQAQDAVAAETVRIVQTFADTGRVLNCVNVREARTTDFCVRVRHLNKPGVLAHVLGVLSHAGINVEDMENTIMSGAHAACAHIHTDARPSEDVLHRIRDGLDSVLAVTLLEGTRSQR